MFKANNISKKINNHYIFKDISLHISKGEKVAIIGSSGSGKSTLLKCFANLRSYSGTINFAGKQTLVFQEFNLFPHMTVLENVCYVPINILNIEESTANNEAMQLLKDFEIEEHKHKYPNQLSGGQQQRVAIIRGIMAKVDLLIMDEPSSSLDNSTTLLVAKILKNLPLTILFATHDDVFLDNLATKVFELKKNGALIELEK